MGNVIRECGYYTGEWECGSVGLLYGSVGVLECGLIIWGVEEYYTGDEGGDVSWFMGGGGRDGVFFLVACRNVSYRIVT